MVQLILLLSFFFFFLSFFPLNLQDSLAPVRPLSLGESLLWFSTFNKEYNNNKTGVFFELTSKKILPATLRAVSRRL